MRQKTDPQKQAHLKKRDIYKIKHIPKYTHGQKKLSIWFNFYNNDMHRIYPNIFTHMYKVQHILFSKLALFSL